MLNNDWIALIITFLAAVLWLRLNDYLAHRGWVAGWLSRKFIHIGTGPIYVLCWLLFSTEQGRYFAMLVPLAITLQFLLVGVGIIRDQAAVQAMSRTGDRREILRGPLYYGIIFVLMTILYWYESPIGIVALMLMCGGDGLADILGRKYGSIKLPWNKNKSWMGSLGMFLGGFVLSWLVLAVYQASGALPAWNPAQITPLLLISVAGAIVESLPLADVDNVTVTLAAIIVGRLVL